MDNIIDLTSDRTIERKRVKATKARNSATDMRLTATRARTECRMNETIEQWYDIKADRAFKHSVMLREDRWEALDKIADYQ